MLQYDITFILVHLSTLFTFIILYFILKTKKKAQIHIIFLCLTLLQMLWNLGILFDTYTRELFKYSGMSFVYFTYFSICFLPVCIFLLGLSYSKTKIKYNFRYLILFIIPVITTVIIWTNNLHHLFFIKYSTLSEEALYGPYYYFHSIYSYTLILIGLAFLFISSLKNSGFFSNQSKLILLGIVVPLAFNILYSFNIMHLSFEINSVVFTFASGCFAIAILKFNFLNIAPIALQQVIDRISDGFIVINEDGSIIDFNETMRNAFSETLKIKRNDDLFSLLRESNILDEKNLDEFESNIYKAYDKKDTIVYEQHIFGINLDKYFTIEITPIISKKNYLGTIVLFKDITQNKKDIATIEEKHAIMMEQERLASLGQLIGGIAHNLKTPIMSIAGAVEGLKDLVTEYEQSIGDKTVTSKDHHEIVSEMRTWLDKIKPYCAYMTDIIDTVKGQTMQSSASSMFGFTVNELIKRVELLLKYELIRYNCKMNTTINVDINTEFYGDVNSLVQVFDNIIINAIQAYGGKNGQIDLIVDRKDKNILFTIRDYARGIPENIKNRLLKEMVTTKGKNGTGLGLYMSNSTIKGRFGGKMWFESESGKGATFFIQLPHKKQLT